MTRQTETMEIELLTPAELAEMTKMSEQFIAKHIQSRKLPGMVQCGRHWRFIKADVIKQVNSGKLLID